jgi:uncharacterized protein YdaU (DUF1376 family)
MSAQKPLPTQGRDAPAYQEFAASMIARLEYREMSLGERGLLYTLRNECWVNRRLPSDPARLARVLSYTVEEIRTTLPRVMQFFKVQGESLICPELEDYRHYQDARRERMSEGGKKSAEKRKGTKRDAVTDINPASTLQAPSKHPVSSLQALRQDKSKPDKSKPAINVGITDDDWTREYEQTEETDNDYARASRGG